MAFTESTMMPLGAEAPSFTLPEPRTDRQLHHLDAMNGVANVLVFWCNHCPYVLYIEEKMLALYHSYKNDNVTFTFINSNDVANYPADSPDEMAKRAQALYGDLPYLYDESQNVARAYDAACTPDIFVFDKDRKLAYRGRFDSARPKNDNPITGEDLKAAIDALIQGQLPNEKQYPSGGCNIKWKK